MKKIVITSIVLLLLSSYLMAANPASQDWVRTWVTSHFLPSASGNTGVNWPLLCEEGQDLTDALGCTPNCNSSMSSPVCNALFEAGQVEQLTGIPRPYLDTGVIIFKLTQLTPAPDDILNITLNAVPTNYGYTCEFLNANGTPAILWDIQTPYPFPTSIITLDSTVLPAKPIQSDNLVTTITQTAGLTSYWYNNIRNPLYMVCLGYQVITGTTDRQSHPVCGGTTGNTCISYLLQ